jgi:CxxC motif-containing protein (DUF1111 family)
MAGFRFLHACVVTSIALVGSTAISGLALGQTVDTTTAAAVFNAQDPGVRGGAANAGGPLPGLTAGEFAFFDVGKDDFAEAEGVGDGLGPRFNLDSCGGCHAQPATGGSSPAVNPQVAVATAFGAKNVVPSFIRANGPVREARFQKNPDGSPDGGVHALFVISGRVDATGNASGCTIQQEDFETQVINRNVIFRIPTPVFGAGLIESIRDTTLNNNVAANSATKAALGISGRLNHNGNDGRVSRFGWKAQNPSLLVFSGEAYNVEMGITNDNFNIERDETSSCQFAAVPNDTQLFDTTAGFPALITAIENFSNFQRFLNQPTPVASFPGASSTSVSQGRAIFAAIGCSQCHTPSLRTSSKAATAALNNKVANLFSDVALHNMGNGLADGISQGGANGNEFRTAPLWGLGKRIFFLHDGRTRDLEEAIRQHASAGSEANGVVGNFNQLGQGDRQDLLNFLRSL